jgi:hypothetical protein
MWVWKFTEEQMQSLAQGETPEGLDCPKCGFVSYGARYVHGRKAYEYQFTQEAWLERKVDHYRRQLWAEIPPDPRKKTAPFPTSDP